MSAEVVKLTERLLPGEADQGLCEALRDLLGRAERGEITALAWVGYRPNDSLFHAWEAAGGTMFQLGAGIMCLQARYALMMSEPDE